MPCEAAAPALPPLVLVELPTPPLSAPALDPEPVPAIPPLFDSGADAEEEAVLQPAAPEPAPPIRTTNRTVRSRLGRRRLKKKSIEGI